MDLNTAVINIEFDLSATLDTLERRIALAERVSVLPGIQVDDIRTVLRLPRLGDEDGRTVLNLPFEVATFHA